VAYPIDRRTFLSTLTGVGALVIGGPALLEACSSSSKSSSSSSSSSATATTAAAGATATTAAASSSSTAAPGSLGTLSFMASWVPDVETGGEYIAISKGYWTQQGFSSVNLIPGGPNATPQETMVQTGKALIAVSSFDSTAAAIEKGFGLVVIGAQYQKNPFAIMSPATKPILTPQQMIGKKIGIQSDNDAVWAAFLKANNISMSQLTTVPVGFDPTPLTQGTVDAWFSFIDNEPIELMDKGFATKTFLLADFNYPEIGNVYICTKDSLSTARDKVKAAMIGDILGWKDALTNPTEAANLAVQKGQGLTFKDELLQANIQNTELMAIGDALTSGLFYVTPASQTASCKTIALGGTNVTPSQCFDMSLLDEIYSDPTLKATPTPVSTPPPSS
jgi:ABC-type nitrate/sulfonate/bicarbonate transport system substrate-binding protein